MMKSILIMTAILSFLSCSRQHIDGTITLTQEVINDNYIGNGAQWDPYDEVIAWGSYMDDAEWEKLLKRVDFMKPGFIRCLINSPYTYYDAKTETYNKTRNNESILKLLKYCTDNNITVLFGEYNPPTNELYQDQKWVDWAVDYLNYLVIENGMSCIKYYNFFNEPDGHWASTNGDYEKWHNMVLKFSDKMKEYPGLSEKVQIAGPDAVIGYKNPNSAYDAPSWVAKTAADMDNIIGLYDVHAYPGQMQVRSGEFAHELKKYIDNVPAGKKIVLGEAGYKYTRPEDSILMKEYNRRVEGHPFTKGSDCNMLVYDFFYGLDMPLLNMNVINAGYSGMTAWMLDDAMHSNWDSGKTEDIKLWGFWNSMGSKVFNDPSQEEIRPWFFSWSLMCRYFQHGSVIYKLDIPQLEGINAVANVNNGKTTIAIVNFSDKDYSLQLDLGTIKNAKTFLYQEGNLNVDADGLPLPLIQDQTIKNGSVHTIQSQSFVLITNNEF